MSDDDEAVLAGYTEGDWVGSSSGSTDAAVAKLAADGTPLWTKQVGRLNPGKHPPHLLFFNLGSFFSASNERPVELKRSCARQRCREIEEHVETATAVLLLCSNVQAP